MRWCCCKNDYTNTCLLFLILRLWLFVGRVLRISRYGRMHHLTDEPSSNSSILQNLWNFWIGPAIFGHAPPLETLIITIHFKKVAESPTHTKGLLVLHTKDLFYRSTGLFAYWCKISRPRPRDSGAQIDKLEKVHSVRIGIKVKMTSTEYSTLKHHQLNEFLFI